MESPQTYNASSSEEKWQREWERSKVFVTKEAGKKKNYYVLEMFPYPSGRIHMGHLRNYTIGDVVARFKSAQGYNVLHPMGWDAFGLPAENAAIQNKVHPSAWTHENIDHMRGQLKSIGFSYDWGREVATCDPEYFKHEQKFFLEFLKAGIAYQKESVVNWDPVDQTVLANEQVIEGRGWRSGTVVERKKLRQWFLRISDFADDLLSGLEGLKGKWPDRVITMQERWIGKSVGARIFFDIEKLSEKLEVFTTRPDTIFGAAFCAIAAAHPLAEKLAASDQKLKEFIAECNKMSTSTADMDKAEKKGYDTGYKIQHPFVKDKKLPLYVANFVLMDYGTGAVFGCPAHDQRDFDFAKKYNLPIVQVVSSQNPVPSIQHLAEAYTGDGNLINSDFLNGLSVEDAKKKIIQELKKKNSGEEAISYKLRDWGVSRQRYWGCPIPVIYCNSCGVVPVQEQYLPVKLPEDVDFGGQGNPLDHHPTWKHVDCPECGKKAERETDTFDTFFESSWYFARFCDPKNKNEGFSKKIASEWLPVDQYIGGIEHAVLHLLYARFFTRALNKIGLIDVKEPFKGLLTQGMVSHETYKSKEGKWLYPTDVRKEGDQFVHAKSGESVIVGRIEKMSKSKNNVVDPAGIIEKYGADTARFFMLSDSPPERDLDWSDAGIEGARKYIDRLWRLANVLAAGTDAESDDEQSVAVRKAQHKTVKNVTEDLEKFHLNKAVARIRELTNFLESAKKDTPGQISVLKQALEAVVKLLSPMIPHLSEELWLALGHKEMLAGQNFWPVHDDKMVEDEVLTVVVQVNGKLRATLQLKKDCDDESAKQIALNDEKVKLAVEGKEIKKIIVVPNRIVNVVAA